MVCFLIFRHWKLCENAMAEIFHGKCGGEVAADTSLCLVALRRPPTWAARICGPSVGLLIEPRRSPSLFNPLPHPFNGIWSFDWKLAGQFMAQFPLLSAAG